tara:strand:- start:1091 stop:1198 length:108 start_codon:yes stop_codon:yes gene_type:complete
MKKKLSKKEQLREDHRKTRPCPLPHPRTKKRDKKE